MRRVRDLGKGAILEVQLRGDGGVGFGKGDGKEGWGLRRTWEEAQVPPGFWHTCVGSDLP